MNLYDLDHWCQNILSIQEFSSIDNSINGIQVSHSIREIQKISFAVDACIEVFNRCNNSDVLIVHHGIFWGKNEPLVGNLYGRVKMLIEKKLALYAVHLPLDASSLLGNNYGIAKHLKLERLQPFGLYRGKYIGVCGILTNESELYDIQEQLLGNNVHGALPFGKKKISSVAIISGGGAFGIDEAISNDIDLFITGDATHNIYHQCLESKINVIFAGHYYTEIWGVKLLMEHFRQTIGKEHNIETEFIDLPTGL